MEMVETARADEETGGHCAGSCPCGAMGLRAKYGYGSSNLWYSFVECQ